MFVALLVAICLGLTYIASRTTYWILKVFVGFFWWGLAFYWVKNPLTDPSLQTIVMMLCIGIGLACLFWAFWATSRDEKTGAETGKWKLPFVNNGEDEESENAPTRNERIAKYSRRVYNARNGIRERRG